MHLYGATQGRRALLPEGPEFFCPGLLVGRLEQPVALGQPDDSLLLSAFIGKG